MNFKNILSKGTKLVSTSLDKMKPFPEWTKMDHSLEKTLKAVEKKNEHFTTAQGQPFSEFARKTNESSSEILFKIDEQLKQIQETQKGATDTIPKVRSDLMKLKPLNDDIKAKKKNRDACKDKAEKSSKACERAEKKVEMLRLKNPSSPEFTKAQNEYDLSVKQKQSDATAYEDREALLVTEAKEYKKQLFQVILQALAQYATAKQQSAAAIPPFAEQIADLAVTIPPYTDPSVEVLQTQVQALRSEPVD